MLDFSLPRNPLMRRCYLIYLRNVMPRIAGLLTGECAAYEYLCGSIEKFPSGSAMCQLLEANGFSTATSMPFSFGIASLYHARKG